MNDRLREMAVKAGLDVTVSMTDEGPVWEGYESQIEAFARAIARDIAKLAGDSVMDAGGWDYLAHSAQSDQGQYRQSHPRKIWGRMNTKEMFEWCMRDWPKIHAPPTDGELAFAAYIDKQVLEPAKLMISIAELEGPLMDKSEIERLAFKAGMYSIDDKIPDRDMKMLCDFAKFIADDCSKICKSYSKEHVNQDGSTWPKERIYSELGRAAGAADCAGHIKTEYEYNPALR